MSEALSRWFGGGSSLAERAWASAGPALFIFGCVFVLFALFVARCALRGIPRDAETETRGETVLVSRFLRHFYIWALAPVCRFVLWAGISANVLTVVSALVGVAAGVAAGVGSISLAGWLLLASGVLDGLDGRVARARKSATQAGAALDSVLDRYVDLAFLIGLSWYYRASWVLLPVLLALLGSSLVPYVRARGEGLGVSIKSGLMQRVERLFLFVVGTALTPVFDAIVSPNTESPIHGLAVGMIIFIAVMSNFTALTRLRALLAALSPKPAEGRAPQPVEGRSPSAIEAPSAQQHRSSVSST